MALENPDIVEHANKSNAAMDANFVRGGRRSVADMAALYAIPSDQLKEQVSIVYVASVDKDYKLTSLANKGASSGWQEYRVASTSGAHTIQDEGVDLTQRTRIDFTGSGVTVTDDSVNNKTTITIPAADGSETKVTAGTNTSVSGTGTTADPYIVNAQAGYTDEQAQDATAAALAAGTHTNITVAYDDVAGSISLTASGGSSVSDASATVKGISKLSVAPVLATDPIAVGTNDSRMTDQRVPTDGSVTTAKLETTVQGKVSYGNQLPISIKLDPDSPTNLDWADVLGRVASGTLVVFNSENDVNYYPSATYAWTMESKSSGAGVPVVRTVSSLATFNTFINDIVSTSDTSQYQIRITLPSNVPVRVKAYITLNRY